MAKKDSSKITNKDNTATKSKNKTNRKHKCSKFCKVFGIVVLAIVVLLTSGLVFILHAPYSFANTGECLQNNKHVIANIPNIREYNPKINELAMLGSHDSFSNEITKKSETDPAEAGGLLSKKFVRDILGEMQVRYSVAQRAGALEQLNAGVRYFDVRLSYVDGVWWTKHGFLSAPFENYLLEILQFMSENIGEVIILDFQHVFTAGENISVLFDYLATVKYESKSIYNFMPYGNDLPFKNLSYNVVTLARNISGAVLFVDYNELLEPEEYQTSLYAHKFYDRQKNVRSLWHDSNHSAFIVKEINAEYENIQGTTDYDNLLRINQTQHAIQLKFGSILRNVTGWSLLNLAENHNLDLLNNSEFDNWLSAMPIFMVDFATSTKGDFNTKVNYKIIEYNRRLCSGGTP